MTDGEYEELAPEVREYEPSTALVAGDDGLRDIRQILDVVSDRLSPGGTLFMEIGHLHADAITELTARYPALTLKEIAADLQKIPRVAIIERKIIN